MSNFNYGACRIRIAEAPEPAAAGHLFSMNFVAKEPIDDREDAVSTAIDANGLPKDATTVVWINDCQFQLYCDAWE